MRAACTTFDPLRPSEFQLLPHLQGSLPWPRHCSCPSQTPCARGLPLVPLLPGFAPWIRPCTVDALMHHLSRADFFGSSLAKSRPRPRSSCASPVQALHASVLCFPRQLAPWITRPSTLWPSSCSRLHLATPPWIALIPLDKSSSTPRQESVKRI